MTAEQDGSETLAHANLSQYVADALLVDDTHHVVPGPITQWGVLAACGDAVEAWLRAQRDAAADHPEAWQMMDGLLDLYRLHADTRTPLDQHVCEGGTPDDCHG
ncbi:hypothetical protein [Kitasatospora camelliae]|uniref:Uncharacterized protein n=1 Tax=Kitasatospora camelliae TaxID=3156397 RepID=A0AAU8K672_9ACTN